MHKLIMTVVRTAERRDVLPRSETATDSKRQKKTRALRSCPLAEAPMKEAPQTEKSATFNKIVERLKEIPVEEKEPGMIEKVVKRVKGLKKAIETDNDKLIDEALDSEIPSEVVARGPLAIAKIKG